MRIATRQTTKFSLRLAILFVAITATRAGAAGVTRFDFFDTNALLTGNVTNLCKQRSESPSVMDKALLFGDADSISDMFQIFDCDNRSVAFDCFAHDAVCDIPHLPINCSVLFLNQPLQQSPDIPTSAVPCSGSRKRCAPQRWGCSKARIPGCPR